LNQAPPEPDDSRWKHPSGLRRLRGAWRVSRQGLSSALHTESAFRQELLAFCLLCPVAVLLPVDRLERLILVLTMGAVLVVELINSAIEAVVDRVGLEHHLLSGRAKDLGSAAVMLSLLLSGLAWGVVLWPLIFG
jgi:diacylglycerol kinase (ATP)